MNSKHDGRRDVSWELGRSGTAGLKSWVCGGKMRAQSAGGGGGRDGTVGLDSCENAAQTLGPTSRRASSHVGMIFGALWRPPRRSATLFCPTRTPAQGARAPLLAVQGPPKFLPIPARQQALMNKRPIRHWGAADEWTFRFQAWHLLGFPGLQGRAGRSRLPEPGHH